MHDTSDADTLTEDPGLSRLLTAGLPTRERGYLIPASDANGHQVRLYCRASPDMGRLLADLHSSRQYPFRTIGDIIRFCIYDGVRRLLAGGGVESVLQIVDMQQRLYADDEMQLHFLSHFQDLRRVTDAYIEAGSPGEARRLVAHARGAIETMADDYWKARYLEELMSRYGPLLDAEGLTGAWDADADETTVEADVPAA